MLVGMAVFVVEMQVAIYAQGSNDETPFTFASAVPGMKFHWSTTNMDVITLASVYDKVNVHLHVHV